VLGGPVVELGHFVPRALARLAPAAAAAASPLATEAEKNPTAHLRRAAQS
jgi:hypothetical protein